MQDFLGSDLGSLNPPRGRMFGPGNIYMRSHNSMDQNYMRVAQGSGFPMRTQGGAEMPIGMTQANVNAGPASPVDFPRAGTVYQPLGYFPTDQQAGQIAQAGVPPSSRFGAIYFPPVVWDGRFDPGNPLSIYRIG